MSASAFPISMSRTRLAFIGAMSKSKASARLRAGRTSVPLRGAGNLRKSRASTRLRRAGNFSLLAQRKVTKRKRVRASTPQEELHKGYARGCRVHVQLGRTNLKGCSLRMRSECRRNPEGTSCTWNPQSAIQKHREYPPEGVTPRAFSWLLLFARAKRSSPLAGRERKRAGRIHKPEPWFQSKSAIGRKLCLKGSLDTSRNVQDISKNLKR